MPKLLIATRNKGKIAEIAERLSGTGIEAVGLADVGCDIDVEESGDTFEANAMIKAREYSLATGLATLADDSGLEVFALGGRPGVQSARYGGDAGYDEKMRRLLGELDASGSTDRTARFVCVMAAADANGEILMTAEGECRGRLAEAARGSGGFGYDPIFIPEGFDQSFGELAPETKAAISHRAKALEIIIAKLPGLLRNLT